MGTQSFFIVLFILSLIKIKKMLDFKLVIIYYIIR